MSIQNFLRPYATGLCVGAVDAYLRQLPTSLIAKTAGFVGVTLAVSNIANRLLVGLTVSLCTKAEFSLCTTQKLAAVVHVATEAAFLTGLFALRLLSVQSFATICCISLANRAYTAYSVQSGSQSIRSIS